MEIAYLASPYSHPEIDVRVKRYHAVCRAAAELIKQGVLVFSPIAHSHPIAVRFNLDGSFETWRDMSLEMLRRCDRLILLKLPGWEESKGMAAEIEEAKRLGMPIEDFGERG